MKKLIIPIILMKIITGKLLLTLLLIGLDRIELSLGLHLNPQLSRGYKSRVLPLHQRPKIVGLVRLERTTNKLWVCYSDQLSYRPQKIPNRRLYLTTSVFTAILVKLLTPRRTERKIRMFVVWTLSLPYPFLVDLGSWCKVSTLGKYFYLARRWVVLTCRLGFLCELIQAVHRLSQLTL